MSQPRFRRQHHRRGGRALVTLDAAAGNAWMPADPRMRRLLGRRRATSRLIASVSPTSITPPRGRVTHSYPAGRQARRRQRAEAGRVSTGSAADRPYQSPQAVRRRPPASCARAGSASESIYRGECRHRRPSRSRPRAGASSLPLRAEVHGAGELGVVEPDPAMLMRTSAHRPNRRRRPRCRRRGDEPAAGDLLSHGALLPAASSAGPGVAGPSTNSW